MNLRKNYPWLVFALTTALASGASLAQSTSPSVSSPFVYYQRVKVTPLPQMSKVTTSIGQAILASANSPASGGQPSGAIVQPDSNPNTKPLIPLQAMRVNAGDYHDLEPAVARDLMTPNIPSVGYLPSAALPACGNDQSDNVYALSNDSNRIPLYYTSTTQVWDKNSAVSFNRAGIVSPVLKQSAPSLVGPLEALQLPLAFHFALEQRPVEQYLQKSATGALDQKRPRALVPTSVHFVPSDGSISRLAGFRAGLALQFPKMAGSTSYCKVPGVSPGIDGPAQASHEFFLLASLDRDVSRTSITGTLKVRFDNDFSGTLNIPVNVNVKFPQALPSFNLNTTAAHYCTASLKCPHTEFPVGDNPAVRPGITLTYSEDQTASAQIAGTPHVGNANPLKIETYLKHNRRAANTTYSNEAVFMAKTSPVLYGIPVSNKGISSALVSNPVSATSVSGYPFTFLPFGSNPEVSSQTYIQVKPADSGLSAGLHEEVVSFPLLTAFGPTKIEWKNTFEILKKNFMFVTKSDSNTNQPSSMLPKVAAGTDSLTVKANLTTDTLRVYDFWIEPERPFLTQRGYIDFTSWATERQLGMNVLNHRSLVGRPSFNVILEGPDASKYRPVVRPYMQSFTVATSKSGVSTRTLGNKVYQDSFCKQTASISFKSQTYQCVLYDLIQFQRGTLHGFEVALTDLSGAKPIRTGNVVLRVDSNSNQGQMVLNTVITR